MSEPLCPITGQPPKRLIQRMSRALLRDLWRLSHGASLGTLLDDTPFIELWESPTGLAYFHPAIVGDDQFYDALYGPKGFHTFLGSSAEARCDFVAAGHYIRAGARVLDVGCGEGVFRRLIPQAEYVGIDSHASALSCAGGILAESLGAHLRLHGGMYDVVCAFQVIEHVADPLAFARSMVAALKPGGLLILACPLWPSPLTEIPNLAINAPPHHVSWWTESAFEALAAALDLTVVETRALPPGRASVQIWLSWMARLTWVRLGGRYYRHRWAWHLNLLIASLLGRAAISFGRLPPGALPLDVFLCARKAG